MPRRALIRMLSGVRRSGTAAVEPLQTDNGGARHRIFVVGSPNVGKSLLFHRLTGHYVVVSNYPGTTVEVARGRMRIGDRHCEVVDTPGMYSLRSVSDEERVARSLLVRERADVVVHVADAKNLERMLPLTLQLLEAELPVVLAVNMMDEAEKLGLTIDLERLERRMGMPVVGTVALTGRGVDDLREAIHAYVRCRPTAAA